MAEFGDEEPPSSLNKPMKDTKTTARPQAQGRDPGHRPIGLVHPMRIGGKGEAHDIGNLIKAGKMDVSAEETKQVMGRINKLLGEL